jgi:tRNA(fMet)-specific endonuclease VapC
VGRPGRSPCPAHYGRIREDLERNGTPIGSMDMLIAAHALALDATLISNNVDHFRASTV